MKNGIVLGMTGLLMLGTVSQASAYFTSDGATADNRLIQVVYNKDFNQVHTDLGVIGVDFQLTDQNKTLANVGSANYVTLANVAAIGNLSMAYFAKSPTDWEAGPVGVWFATTSNTAPNFSDNFNNVGLFDDAAIDINKTDVQNGGNVSKTVSYSAINANGYFMKYSSNGAGGYNDNNLDASKGEAKLVAGEDIDMYLYHFTTDAEFNYMLDAGASTPYAAVLRLTSDGNVVLNPVPVPGAVWLLGSGLAGLAGIRRRKNS